MEYIAGHTYWYWDKRTHKPESFVINSISGSGFYFFIFSRLLFCSFEYANGRVFDDFYTLPGIDDYLVEKRKKIALEKRIENEKWAKYEFVSEHYPNNPDPDYEDDKELFWDMHVNEGDCVPNYDIGEGGISDIYGNRI